MTSAVLIPWAQTEWQAAGRHASSTPVELNAHAAQQIEQWADMISAHSPVTIYFFDRDPGSHTARLIAARLGIKAKVADGLEEVSMGLWEGLTPSDMKKRFAKAYRQWKEDPASVCPPEGETLPSAGERLAEEFQRLAKKHENACFAVLTGPLAFAALRCNLENAAYNMFWKMATDKPVKYLVNVDQNKALLAP